MKAKIKSIIRNLIPKRVTSIISEPLIRETSKRALCYSQEGEDLIVEKFFLDQNEGFYVDVGAHHPWRFSNTYLFYKKGWRGINIDPRPGIMEVFARERPNDINLELAIGDKDETRPFFIFNEPGLSTFSEEEAKKKDGCHGGIFKIVGKKQIRVKRLESVLDEFMPPSVQIDFMSIDAEGLDLEVVRSNNWDKYVPKVVIIEQLESSIGSLLESEAYRLFEKLGYELSAKCFNSIIFKHK